MRPDPEQEQKIFERILNFRYDPVGFVLWNFPWGRAGTPLEKYKGPRRWQMEELELYGEHLRQQRFAIDNGLPAQIYCAGYASGRGPGKSALFGMLSNHMMSVCLGGKVVVVANTETQLRGTTFPELAKWFKLGLNSYWFQTEGMKISPEKWLAEMAHEQKGINADQWVCAGKTWTEENLDAYVGEHNDYGLLSLFDEASGIHSEVWEKTEGFYTETTVHRGWFGASQMRNRKGRFYEIFNDLKLGAGWRARTLSTRGMEGVDQAIVESQIQRYGADSDFVRVEILGLPPSTSEDQFIPKDAVTASQRNALVPDYGEPLILGVDPAPRGKTAWRFRQGRNARDCCGPATHGHWLGYDNIQIAEEILRLDNKFRPDHICIDFGLGTGVIDYLKRKKLHARLHEVKFGIPAYDRTGEWETHAAELWAWMRDWLPGGMIEHDEGEKGSLTDQLTNRGWRWSGREEGKKILETKEDMAKRGVKSPDDGDALAITMEMRNAPRTDFVPRGRKSGQENRIAEGVPSNPYGN